MIDQAIRRHRLALVVRHPGLAESDAAGGEIQHQRRLADTRESGAEGVGADAGVDAAEWRDQRVASDVDEVEGHQAGVGALLGPVADAADVMGIAQPDCANPELLRALDAQRHRLMRGDLAEAASALYRQHCAGIARNLRMDVQRELAIAQ